MTLLAIKLVAATVVAFVVFFTAQVPILLYLHQSFERFEPNAGLIGITGQSGILAALYLFAAPRSWPLWKAGAFGALAGLLVSLPDQLAYHAVAELLEDQSLMWLFLGIEAWHVAAWGLATTAIALVARWSPGWAAA